MYVSDSSCEQWYLKIGAYTDNDIKQNCIYFKFTMKEII